MRSPARQFALATALAVVAALATYAVARLISGDLVVNGRTGQIPVPAGAVAAASVAGGLAGWAVVWIAGLTRRPRTAFLTLVIAGFAVSGAAPVAAATTTTTAAWLLLLHVVVAVPLVGAGWRLVRSTP